MTAQDWDNHIRSAVPGGSPEPDLKETNRSLPHPQCSKQGYIRILTPEG